MAAGVLRVWRPAGCPGDLSYFDLISPCFPLTLTRARTQSFCALVPLFLSFTHTENMLGFVPTDYIYIFAGIKRIHYGY